MVLFGASNNGNIAVRLRILTVINLSLFGAISYKVDADMQRGASRREGLKKNIAEALGARQLGSLMSQTDPLITISSFTRLTWNVSPSEYLHRSSFSESGSSIYR